MAIVLSVTVTVTKGCDMVYVYTVQCMKSILFEKEHGMTGQTDEKSEK